MRRDLCHRQNFEHICKKNLKNLNFPPNFLVLITITTNSPPHHHHDDLPPQPHRGRGRFLHRVRGHAQNRRARGGSQSFPFENDILEKSVRNSRDPRVDGDAGEEERYSIVGNESRDRRDDFFRHSFGASIPI